MGYPNDEDNPFDVTAAFLRMSPIERRAYLGKAAFDRGRQLDPVPATLRALAIQQRHASQSWAKRTWSIAEDLGSIAKHTSPAWWTYHLISGSDDEASDGLSRILSAVDKSLDAASSMMIDESLDIGNNLIHGIVPMLKTLAWWAAVGTVGGGAIGAVGGLGIFDAATVPEGMFWGFELAMVLGGYWALKDLLLEASKHLDRFTILIGEAAELAWFAGEDGVVSEQHDINDAAKLFAFAIVELWWVVLNALIVLVLKRVGEIAAKAVGRAVAGTALARALGDIKANVASKFGASFGEWFEKDFEKLRKAVDEHENKGKSSQDDADGGGGEGSGTGASSRPWKGPTDYSSLKNPRGAGPGKGVTTLQKQRMYDLNRQHNGGVLRDDVTGEELVEPKKSMSGVPPPANEAQIDHVQPESKGGTNQYDNLQVRSRAANRAKSDTWDGDGQTDDGDPMPDDQ